MCLNELGIGNMCKVKKINANGEIAQKLLDMGFVPGTRLKIVRSAPLGDPIKIKIREYIICIRLNEAKLIEIKEMD
ncbi:ferrous iron transport protein A [Fusobacterium sp. MFO224]|uniref:FeoA family protein n=1 Tax=Fusobacterium sp. MFO224 TaxID=3378070 RepID=UPI003851D2F6